MTQDDEDTQGDPEEEERANSSSRTERERRRGDDKEESADKGSSNGKGEKHDSPSNADEAERVEIADGRPEDQLDVPQINADLRPSVGPIDLIEELPRHNAETGLQVAQFESSPLGVFESEDLDTSLLDEANVTNVELPQLKLKENYWLDPKELNEDLPEVQRAKHVSIPQLTVDTPGQTTSVESLDQKLIEKGRESPNKGYSDNIETEGTEEDSIEESSRGSAAVSASSEAASSDHWANGEWPDPLELLLGNSGSEVNSGNPMVVQVQNDELVGVVEVLVKRMHREKERGEPEVTKIDSAEGLTDEERWVDADSRIFSVELSSDEWDALESHEEYQTKWESIWKNRVDQLFSGQKFGAIIFNSTRVPEMEALSSLHHPPKIVTVEENIPWWDLAEVFWGQIDAEPENTRTFSQLFDRGSEGLAEKSWNEVKEALDGKFDFATYEDEDASDEHYDMKVLVVKWLSEKLWEEGKEFNEYDDLAELDNYLEIEDVISTEETIVDDELNPVIADVKYGPRVFEVETFFKEDGKGGVASKLQDSARKYDAVETPSIQEINFVIDHLSLLLHLRDLARFKRNHRHWERENDIEINIYTIDLVDFGLVSIGTIIDDLIGLSLE